MSLHGTISAVCTSNTAGLTKQPVQSAKIGQWGLEGDFHGQQFRQSHRNPGTLKPNTDRQITLVSFEAIQKVCRDLQIPLIKTGGLGENVLTLNLGDLSDVLPGSKVYIGRDIELEVTAQNLPCTQLKVYHEELPKHLVGKRGLLCIVKKGIGTQIKAGQKIRIVGPEEHKN